MQEAQLQKPSSFDGDRYEECYRVREDVRRKVRSFLKGKHENFRNFVCLASLGIQRLHEKIFLEKAHCDVQSSS